MWKHAWRVGHTVRPPVRWTGARKGGMCGGEGKILGPDLRSLRGQCAELGVTLSESRISRTIQSRGVI